MKKYKVKMTMQQEEKYTFWDFSIYFVQAQGIVHAHKLAIRHLREIKKLYSKPIRIEKVIEVGLE